jgi:hypothetical protein
MTGQHEERTVVLKPLKSRDTWETLCSTFLDATAFHHYDFLESVAPLLSCSFVPLMVSSCDQSVGLVPLLVKKLGPFCTVNWVPFPYLGPLVPRDLLPATLGALKREARRRRALNHQQSFSEVVRDDGFDGFKTFRDRTFVIPLSGRSDEDLLAAMQTTLRGNIRRAQRSEVEVCTAEIDDFALMEIWLGQLYTAKGMPAMYPAGTCERVFHALQNVPGSIFSAARLEGRTVAVLIAFSTVRSAFCWQYATDPLCRSKHLTDLLIWHAILQARDSGAIEFDLVGAPNEGIANYKRRFGAAERHYTVLQKQARVHRIAVDTLYNKIPKLAPGH